LRFGALLEGATASIMAKKKSTAASAPAPAAGPDARGGPAPYLVLARKYRPTTFAGLLGQEAMLTTLRNAFASDRIAQGYMLTGVRGVGKTTTARILSRALNYERDGVGKPTFDMPEFGRHCAEIMEGRHPDVLEMDAASNTGVDNVREIIESARYKPLVARCKVYLIDEVHMLSKGAFNALLKTLEEPPGHVKFIFATTEVRKVPVTVLSRTQRFDLRRVDVPLLVAHFRKIIANEGAQAEDAALSLIARASEGSVRDGLSLLDQALAMGSGSVTTERVRAMLGLADRGRIFDLLELILGNAAREAVLAFGALNRDGAEPSQVLADLAEAVHIATRAKTLGGEAAGDGLSAEERRRASALAERLSVPILARAWQMLLKGLEEVSAAPNAAAAAEMVLIRLAYTADLPAPDEVLKALGGLPAPRREVPAPAPPPRQSALESSLPPADPEAEEEDGDLASSAARPPLLLSFVDVVRLAGKRRDAKLKVHLEEHVSLVKFDPAGSIELNLLPGAPKELPNELREKLNLWTERRWMVALSKTPGEPPLGEVERARAAAEIAEIRKHPAVAAVLQQFPDAEVSSVRPLSALEADDADDTGTG
jgi:DNA polymerase III subunit gamma/tau